MQGRPNGASGDPNPRNDTSVTIDSDSDNGSRHRIAEVRGSSPSQIVPEKATILNDKVKAGPCLSTEKDLGIRKQLALSHTESIIASNPIAVMPLESPKQRLAMESSTESHRLRRARTRNPWICSGLVLFVTVSALLILSIIVYSYQSLQVDPQGCRTPSMRPTYIKLVGFDSEHTRFASKYGLYLYRERGVDEYSEEDIGIKGVPVLFLPGNAGSYKQGRSLASEASLYFHDVLQYHQERLKTGVRGLDFFMADFNEDMAAFHGQTLLDQAEYVNDALAYILSLYHDPRRPGRDLNLPDPTSVILIGHSMGGIVARTVLTMSNYQTNSVNTIITMSTPHARPPVSFDSDLVHTYKQVNNYWREAYSQKWANNNPLWHVTLISIAGGGGDTIVPSDYTSLSSLVPETHGFTVFTTTIPNVWTGMDHLSIAWCDSFRKVIIRSLFDVIDVRRSSQTKQRADRMSVFKKWYLTGMEVSAERKLPRKEHTTLLTLGDDTKSKSILRQDEKLTLRGFGHRKGPNSHLMPIPPRGGVPGKKLTLLTDQKLNSMETNRKLDVLFCSDFPLRAGQSATLPSLNLDLSGGSASSIRLVCKSAAEDVISLPTSTSSSKFAFDNVPSLSYLQYDLEDLTEYQFVVVIDKAETRYPGWLHAEFSDSSDSVIPTRVGLGRLLSAGLNIRLPAERPMVIDIKVPALHSSLLAYKLHVESKDCDGTELFKPMVRQYISGPYESKFFVNVRDAEINLHGIAPYMPPHIGDNAAATGISFQLWSDASCNGPLQLSLKVDVLGSMGKLAMRYRTVFAAFPLLVVSLVLRQQFKVYNQTGIFISFMQALDLCIRSSIPLLFLGLTFLASSLATSKNTLSKSASPNAGSNSTESVIDFSANDLLLGSQDAFFWFLVPLFGIISIGTCVIVNYVAMILIHALGAIRAILMSRKGYIKHDERGNTSIFWSLSTKNRVINTAVLLLFVATFIPYQFAYVVACVVQLVTCVQASWHARETRSASHSSFYNYVHSIFILMIWILPINVLVLIVWIHDLAVHWLTPFSSNHNVFSILPFMLLVETLTCGTMIPRITTHLRHITYVLFFFLAAYSAIYGVTYAYLLHHITNLVIAWLVGIHFFAGGFSLRNLSRVINDSDGVPNGSPITDGHIKKLP
ncbi:GPI inositol-deacylase [Coccidioides posadasii str. Silveira]|uniref:GPI inositol-deacylase n=2 Tax=Coccidioides posadasii TaxID=199306 RepID=E9D8A0_COCPS|nr:GPI inositol-deacylase [Coccidioides posadasii str. Silveira]KMM70749.1 GPI inositol-deacylase [Coccidioides posadasii RMSCC 3488]